MTSAMNCEPESVEELNPFVIAQRQCDTAARYLPSLEAGLFELLKRPDKLITVEFPIATTSGEVLNFVGYRAVHSRVRGPGKGGIRYHPDVTPARSGPRSSVPKTSSTSPGASSSSSTTTSDRIPISPRPT